jgi:xylan 1,4-beta-xylosidase
MKRLLLFLAFASAAWADSFPVHIEVDAAQPIGPLKPIWRFFGADEPNYAYMPHGRELLGELGELKKDEVFFRTHSLLSTGKGEHGLKWGSTNAYTEDAAGKPVYDWSIVDRIFDTYREQGVRPYVQIGFMPQALSVKPEPYRHHFPDAKYEELFGGWAYPPKDFAKWEELVFQWAKHCAERYGSDEVLRWYWQTWNEPNIDYWRGTREEFFKLHDHAIHAVRRAIPGAKVGGPDLAGGKGGDFLEAFLNHCLKGRNRATGETGTPLDFISFHAKGSPKQIDGHVRMGIANQLREIDEAFAVIASHPEVKDKPIIIGESDPDGCAACKGADRDYRNGTMYSSYTAAIFPRKLDLAAKHGVNLEGALTWSFEFEGQPYFAGFRSLATNGIDKPVLNVFRMFARMTWRSTPRAKRCRHPARRPHHHWRPQQTRHLRPRRTRWQAHHPPRLALPRRRPPRPRCRPHAHSQRHPRRPSQTHPHAHRRRPLERFHRLASPRLTAKAHRRADSFPRRREPTHACLRQNRAEVRERKHRDPLQPRPTRRDSGGAGVGVKSGFGFASRNRRSRNLDKSSPSGLSCDS